MTHVVKYRSHWLTAPSCDANWDYTKVQAGSSSISADIYSTWNDVFHIKAQQPFVQTVKHSFVHKVPLSLPSFPIHGLFPPLIICLHPSALCNCCHDLYNKGHCVCVCSCPLGLLCVFENVLLKISCVHIPRRALQCVSRYRVTLMCQICLKRAHWSAGGPLWLSPSHTCRKLPQGPPYDHCTPHTHTADIFPQSSSIVFLFRSVAWHSYKTCRAHQSFSPKCMCICIRAHVFTVTPWSAVLCIKAQKKQVDYHEGKAELEDINLLEERFLPRVKGVCMFHRKQATSRMCLLEF